MPIKIMRIDQVRVNVQCEVPRESGVGWQKESFVAVIRKLYDEEAKAFQQRIEQMSARDGIKELVIGLEQIKGDDGKAVEFSEQLLDEICKIDYYWIPLWQQCMAVQNELVRKEMQQKN